MIKKYFFLIFLYSFGLFSSKLFASTAQLEWQHFTSKPSLKEQLSDYLLFKVDHEFDWERKAFAFKSHVLMEHSFDQADLFYLNPPEFYVSYQYDFKVPLYSIHSLQIHLGRKINNWSEGDEYWKLGLWNPLFYWNNLQPVSAGLVGSLIHLQSQQWQADFFIGAIHLPHSQARMVIGDNKVPYALSRWATTLPRQVENYNLNIYYSTLNPVLSDFLFQQSFLASFKTWSETEDRLYWLKWSFANKPSNRLYYILKTAERLKVDPKKNQEPAFIDQQIGALPVRQTILSTEWGLDYKKLSAHFTLEYIQTTEVSANQARGWFWTNSREEFSYFSLLLKYKYNDKSQLQWGWIRSFFKDFSIDENSTNSPPPNILAQTRVLNGWGITWNTEFKNHKGLDSSFSLQYQHSASDRGDWLSAKLRYALAPRFYSEWTVNVLGVENPKSIKNPSFLKNFAHNDYWTWSFAYDF